MATSVKRKPTILSLVHNPGTTDARVMKQAVALRRAGYDIRVFCRLMPGYSEEANFRGVPVSRRGFFDRDAWIDPKVAEEVVSLCGPVADDLKARYEGFRSKQSLAQFWRSEIEADRELYQGSKDHTRVQWREIYEATRAQSRAANEALKAATAADNFHLNYFWFAAHLLQTDLGFVPDVIHVHDLYPLVGALALKRRYGCKVVFDAHEVETERTPPLPADRKAWMGALEAHLLKSVDRMITVSSGCADFYEAHFKERPTLILNAPEVAMEPGPTVRELAGLGPDVPLMVYTGAVAKDVRGVDKIVRSLEFLPNVHLAILGPRRDDFDTWLSEYVSATGTGDRVHMLKPVAADQVVAAISAADVGVYALQNVGLACEVALPNKLFEMSFAGLPLCVSDLKEMKGFVLENGNGRTMVAEDPKSIAEAVQDVLSNPGRYRPTPEKLAQMIHRWGWDRQAEALIRFYEELEPVSA